MKTKVPTVRFVASLYVLKRQTIVRLPEAASQELPSRGQVAVTGAINGHGFSAVLEPDGRWGHWLRVDTRLLQAAGVSAGDTVTFEMTVTKTWPEPKLPKDMAGALRAAPQKVKDKWQDITPMARWEWVRWVNATANMDTRAVRIEKTVAKLSGAHRRPCCFNLAACTDPYLAKNGRLID